MKGRQVVLGHQWGREAAALMVDGQVQDLLLDLSALTTLPPGAICRAVVDRLVKGQGGVFVRLPEGERGFLRDAKGLSEGRLLNRYVLRNALLPSFTAFGMAMGFVVGGAILTETVFSYPGLGLQLYNAVVNLDYPLMQALFLFIAAAVLLANFIVDLLYAFLDPRVRDGKAE